MKSKGKVYSLILALMISLLLSWWTQRLYTMAFHKEYKDNFESIYPELVIKKANMEVVGERYLTTTNDPQFVIQTENAFVDALKIEFLTPLEESMNISVYYAGDEGFSQQYCTSYTASEGDREIYVDIPDGVYKNLRVDIGNIAGQQFCLKDIYITDDLSYSRAVWVFISSFLIFGVLGYIKLSEFCFLRMRLRLLSFGVGLLYCFTLLFQKMGVFPGVLLLVFVGMGVFEILFRLQYLAEDQSGRGEKDERTFS